MGGYGSGRWNFKPYIERSYCMSLSDLKKRGFLGGKGASGSFSWKVKNNSGNAKIQTRRIDDCFNDNSFSELIIDFEVEGYKANQTIRLVREPMRFGGYRYYAICPLSGRRCSKLVFVFRNGIFASLKASGYLYASQKECGLYLLKRKMEKAYDAHVNQSKYNRKSKKHKLWLNAVATEVQYNAELQAYLGGVMARTQSLKLKLGV